MSQLEEQSALATARDNGTKKGLELGRKQGMKLGKEQGVNQGKKEIAKRMIQKGKNIDEIVEMTGLSKEEIERLK